MIDAHSKCPKVFIVPKATSEHTITYHFRFKQDIVIEYLSYKIIDVSSHLKSFKTFSLIMILNIWDTAVIKTEITKYKFRESVVLLDTFVIVSLFIKWSIRGELGQFYSGAKQGCSQSGRSEGSLTFFRGANSQFVFSLY